MPPRRNHGRRADANRHDTYITPPCAALAAGRIVQQIQPERSALSGKVRDDERARWHDAPQVLDPFGGFATLPAWAGFARADTHVLELDGDNPARHPYLDQHAATWQTGDAFGHEWRARIVLTNPPFSRFGEACAKAWRHVAAGDVGAALVLGPIQFWHTAACLQHAAPSAIYALTWRPDFARGFGRDGADASSPSQSYAWFGWTRQAHVTTWGRIARPHVPPELDRAHLELARLAADWPAVAPAPLFDRG